MSGFVNDTGLPIGFPVDDWEPRPPPPRAPMHGNYCDLVPLDMDEHATDLYAANALDTEGSLWVYMPYGPFETVEQYRNWIQSTCMSDDPQFYAVIDRLVGTASGVTSFLRAVPEIGVIEVGHINFAPPLQRTVAATEAMYLMMQRVFDELEYRRYEWKCDALNAKSRAAAIRMGFQYEGTFRQAALYKRRNRDTAWYSITSAEWPAIRTNFETWLKTDNFDADGRQITRLADMRHDKA